MKKLLLLLLIDFIVQSQNIKAQITICNEIPLAYNGDMISFDSAEPPSFGDSMITFFATNLHDTQGFAYPLAKLVPLTPLPAGMSLAPNNQPWSVFASAWNPTETLPVYMFYFVDEEIPADYEVTFEVWMTNLTPLHLDSCFFEETFTINLNPFTTSVHDNYSANPVTISPNPSIDYCSLQWTTSLIGEVQIRLINLMGQTIYQSSVSSGTLKTDIDIRQLEAGVYYIMIADGFSVLEIRKIVVM